MYPSNQGQLGGSQMMTQQPMMQQGFGTAGMMFQPGFADTNAQRVRQDISQDLMYSNNQRSFGGSQMMM